MISSIILAASRSKGTEQAILLPQSAATEQDRSLLHSHSPVDWLQEGWGASRKVVVASAKSMSGIGGPCSHLLTSISESSIQVILPTQSLSSVHDSSVGSWLSVVPVVGSLVGNGVVSEVGSEVVAVLGSEVGSNVVTVVGEKVGDEVVAD